MSPDETFPPTADSFSDDLLFGDGNESVSVVIDHREAPSEMNRCLMKIPNVRVRFDTLETADYSIDGRLLVERKTMIDLAESIVDTRLFRQANRLARSATPAILILEGTGRDFAQTGMSREAIQGALICVTLIYRLPLLRSVDKEETARLMVYAARQLQRCGSGFHALAHRKPKTPRGQKIHLLRTLPGIGTDRARKLLETFGSVEKCLSATAEQLAAVEGIGEKTAQRIRQVVEEDPVVYGEQPANARPRKQPDDPHCCSPFGSLSG